MKKLKFILSLASLLSCTITIANPISHYHGARSHSHSLPNKNVAHRHGSLPIGSLSANNHKQQYVAKNNPNKKNATENGSSQSSKMSNMDKLLMKEYIDTSIRITASMSFGEHADWDEVNRKIIHKKNWQENVKKTCKKLANRMKNKYPDMKVYNYTLTNCVQFTFSKFK